MENNDYIKSARSLYVHGSLRHGRILTYTVIMEDSATRIYVAVFNLATGHEYQVPTSYRFDAMVREHKWEIKSSLRVKHFNDNLHPRIIDGVTQEIADFMSRLGHTFDGETFYGSLRRNDCHNDYCLTDLKGSNPLILPALCLAFGHLDKTIGETDLAKQLGHGNLRHGDEAMQSLQHRLGSLVAQAQAMQIGNVLG